MGVVHVFIYCVWPSWRGGGTHFDVPSVIEIGLMRFLKFSGRMENSSHMTMIQLRLDHLHQGWMGVVPPAPEVPHPQRRGKVVVGGANTSNCN